MKRCSAPRDRPTQQGSYEHRVPGAADYGVAGELECYIEKPR
jgi:hypothetical protein